MKKIFAILGAALVCAGINSCSSEEKLDDNTARTLQNAYNRECNVAAACNLYAEKSAAASYPGVQLLFKAAARSARLSADKFARILRKSGSVPEAKITLPVFVSVEDSLKSIRDSAIKASKTTYPDAIKQVWKGGSPLKIVPAFESAIAANSSVAKFCAEALKVPNRWKTPFKIFYLCSECGVISDAPEAACANCRASQGKYEVFKSGK